MKILIKKLILNINISKHYIHCFVFIKQSAYFKIPLKYYVLDKHKKLKPLLNIYKFDSLTNNEYNIDHA
jgi:hypothetical protein